MSSEKKDTQLIVFPVPGYPTVGTTGTSTYGTPNYDPKDGTPKEFPRGIPWGHTIVIKGMLIEAGDPDKGISNKEIWIHSADGPAPYPERTRTKVAQTKKKGKFITFMRNNDISYGSKTVDNRIVVTFQRSSPYSLSLIFSAPVDSYAGADPEYKISQPSTIQYHSLTHRTSLTVEVDPPDGSIVPGQPIIFTATLRDEDGVYLRDGISPSIIFNVDDVDSINIAVDPLRSVRVHELKGRVIRFSGTGIVPVPDEHGQLISIAVTDENG